MINQPFSPLVVVLAIAHSFVAGGCPELAATVLATHLHPIDPDGAAPDALLIDAAILLARTGQRIDWARYADRASRTLAIDPQQVRRARVVLRALQHGEVITPVPGAQTDAGGANAYQRAEHGLGRFDAAQELHRRGSCGEAVRDDSRALDDFLDHHLRVFPDLAAPMITRFAAMLSACRRDTEARGLLAQHAAHLPRCGTLAWRDFADGALKVMDRLDRRHAPHCAARHDSSRHLRTGIASGTDGLPWNRRRDEWRLLLAADTQSDS